MREDETTSRPDDLRRLPGFEEPARLRSEGSWQSARWRGGYDRDAPGDEHQVGDAQRRYVRESGIRASRRASGWTAAALIATVAATTGYLAHSIPATTTGASTTATGTAAHVGKSTGAHAPAVSGPVVTSGGSGVAAGSAATGGGGN